MTRWFRRIWRFSRIHYEADDNPIESHAIGFKKNPKTLVFSTEVQYVLCLRHHTHWNFVLILVSCSNCKELFQQHILFFPLTCWKYLALAEQKLCYWYNTTKKKYWQELHLVTAAEKEWHPFTDEYQPTLWAVQECGNIVEIEQCSLHFVF